MKHASCLLHSFGEYSLEIGVFSLLALVNVSTSASIEMSLFYLRLRDLGAAPRTGWQPTQERLWLALGISSITTSTLGRPWFWLIASGVFFLVSITSINHRPCLSGLKPW